MPTRIAYKKPWNIRRNDMIAKMFLAGKHQRAIAEKFELTPANVSQIIYRMGGKQAVMERFKAAEPAAAPKVQKAPVWDGRNIDAGLRMARESVARYFIKIAFSLDEDLMVCGKPKDRERFLNKLLPLVKNQVKRMGFSHYFDGFDVEGRTAEELERKLLE